MAPRFFVAAARSDLPILELPAPESHHLSRVLRLVGGAEIAVFDGRGHEWAARVLSTSKRTAVTVELIRSLEPAAEPVVAVTLAIGLLKGDQMDAVVRDATALGVHAIAPFVSEHVAVPKRAWRADAALARWQRIAAASAAQCGRAVVPEIDAIQPLEALVGRTTPAARFVCVEPAHQGARAVTPGAFVRPEAALALVGPEGGWSTRELDRVIASGALPVRLGPRTLRAEIAPAVLLSALWTVWGWSATAPWAPESA